MNSSLLPKTKELQLKQFLNNRPTSAIYIIGNSTQFNLSTRAWETGFHCKVKPLYNLAHVGAEPFTSRKMISFYERAFHNRDIVFWSVHSTLFRLVERVNTESGYLPWRDTEMWLHDMRLGASSIARLYPLLINIQWPSSLNTVFPFIQYYDRQTALTESRKKNFLIRPDGSVYFSKLEQHYYKRRQKGTRLDADNFRRTAARIGKSHLYPDSFQDFSSAIRFLSKRVRKIYIYETTYHPTYQNELRRHARARARFLSFLRHIKTQYRNVELLNGGYLTENITDQHWLDNTHMADRYGSIITRRLSSLIPSDEICTKQ